MILEDTLKYGNVPPDAEPDKEPQETAEVPDLTGSDVTKALSDLHAKGFEAIVEGFGGEVVDQLPKPGSKAAKGSTVLIYLKQVDDRGSDEMMPVPDVSGMGAVDANNTVLSMGFRMNAKGTGGIAVSQSPEAGTALLPGETIEVVFAPVESQSPGSGDEGNENSAEDETGN
jgi:beta-lactam-binding protein with PASTA domain